MEGSRFALFVKLWGRPEWVEHITFVYRFDAETYGSALKTIFSEVEDYCVVERGARITGS